MTSIQGFFVNQAPDPTTMNPNRMPHLLSFSQKSGNDPLGYDWILNDDDTISPALAPNLVLGLGDGTSHNRAQQLTNSHMSVIKCRPDYDRDVCIFYLCWCVCVTNGIQSETRWASSTIFYLPAS